MIRKKLFCNSFLVWFFFFFCADVVVVVVAAAANACSSLNHKNNKMASTLKDVSRRATPFWLLLDGPLLFRRMKTTATTTTSLTLKITIKRTSEVGCFIPIPDALSLSLPSCLSPLTLISLLALLILHTGVCVVRCLQCFMIACTKSCLPTKTTIYRGAEWVDFPLCK